MSFQDKKDECFVRLVFVLIVISASGCRSKSLYSHGVTLYGVEGGYLSCIVAVLVGGMSVAEKEKSYNRYGMGGNIDRPIISQI